VLWYRLITIQFSKTGTHKRQTIINFKRHHRQRMVKSLKHSVLFSHKGCAILLFIIIIIYTLCYCDLVLYFVPIIKIKIAYYTATYLPETVSPFFIISLIIIYTVHTHTHSYTNTHNCTTRATLADSNC